MDSSSFYPSPLPNPPSPLPPQSASAQSQPWLHPNYSDPPEHYATSESPSTSSSTGALQRTPSSLSLNMSSLSVTSSSPITPISNPSLFRYDSDPSQSHPQSHPILYPPSRSPPPDSLSSPSKPASNPRKRSSVSLNVQVPSAPPVIQHPHLYTSYEDDPGSYSSHPGATPSPMDDSPTSSGFPDDVSPNKSGAASGPISSGTNNFVSKLYQMISDPKSSRFISWTEHGTSFVVSNVGEFSRSILGAHFKHNNFSSFVRQLNMYGFSKINRTPRAPRTPTESQTWEFAHPKFLRGRPDLLDEIRRKALEPDPTIKQRVELPGELANQMRELREEIKRMARLLELERERSRSVIRALKAVWDVIEANTASLTAQQANNTSRLELSMPFPNDLLETGEYPPIYITSPVSSTAGYGATMDSIYNMHLSPQSSPTMSEFPHHAHHPVHHQTHPIPTGAGGATHRGLSLPHIQTISPYDSPLHTSHASTPNPSPILPANPSNPLNMRSTPSPISAMDEDEGGVPGRKRQRTNPSPTAMGLGINTTGGVSPSLGYPPSPAEYIPSNTLSPTSAGAGGINGRRVVRARSDSAPHGGLWPPQNQHNGRPRSGSGIGYMSVSNANSGLTVPVLNVMGASPPTVTKEDGGS